MSEPSNGVTGAFVRSPPAMYAYPSLQPPSFFFPALVGSGASEYRVAYNLLVMILGPKQPNTKLNTHMSGCCYSLLSVDCAAREGGYNPQ